MFYSLFPNFELQNFFKKANILSVVLKALNFEDEISMRGECNTSIKTNHFTKQNLFHKSNQQRSSIMVFKKTQNP
jgi:hypothetical protein